MTDITRMMHRAMEYLADHPGSPARDVPGGETTIRALRVRGLVVGVETYGFWRYWLSAQVQDSKEGTK